MLHIVSISEDTYTIKDYTSKIEAFKDFIKLESGAIVDRWILEDNEKAKDGLVVLGSHVYGKEKVGLDEDIIALYKLSKDDV